VPGGADETGAWECLRTFPGRIAPQLAQAAAVQAIRAQPGWTVRVGNRGRAMEDEVTLSGGRLV
jgi:hypothetical protein